MHRHLRKFCAPSAILTFLMCCCSSGEKPIREDLANFGLRVEVTAARATTKALGSKVVSKGVFRALADVRIYAKTSSIVSRRDVANGERVSDGDLILSLENEKESIQLEKSKIVLIEKRIAFTDQVLQYNNDTVKARQAIKNIRYSSGLALGELQHRESVLEFESTFIRGGECNVVDVGVIPD